MYQILDLCVVYVILKKLLKNVLTEEFNYVS